MNADQIIPCLSSGYRMQFETHLDQFVILYPEGLIKLNESSSQILQLCDGVNTIDDIIKILETDFPGVDLKQDVRDFLEMAHAKKWITYQQS